MSKIEPARLAYIRLLSESSSSFDAEPRAKRDGMLCGELIEGGFLSGEPVRDHSGMIVGAAVTGITVQGRLFLQRLIVEESESSLRGRALRYLPVMAAYIAGLLSPIITDWIKSLIGP